MIMQQPVDWYGQQTLLLTDAGHVALHLACLCVLSVFKKVTMKVMTTTCSEVKLEVLVTVAIPMSLTQVGEYCFISLSTVGENIG